MYYTVANAAAFTQTSPYRRYLRWLQVVGAVGCVALMATLRRPAVLAGLAVLVAGVGFRLGRQRLSVARQ